VSLDIGSGNRTQDSVITAVLIPVTPRRLYQDLIQSSWYNLYQYCSYHRILGSIPGANIQRNKYLQISSQLLCPRGQPNYESSVHFMRHFSLCVPTCHSNEEMPRFVGVQWATIVLAGKSDMCGSTSFSPEVGLGCPIPSRVRCPVC